MIETGNLCANCPDEIRGVCCNFLTCIESHLIYLPNHPCKYLNPDTRKCSIYEKRHEINPNCLTLKEMYIKGTLPKSCPYVINDSMYQKRKDTALLTFPFNISNKGKFEFSKLNNQEHYEIGCYDIIRTAICPKCESDNIKEEWADRKEVLFFKYKCKDCNHKWNNFEKWKKAMGIDWISVPLTKELPKGHPLAEAIPPAYSKFIMNEFLRKHPTLMDFISEKQIEV